MRIAFTIFTAAALAAGGALAAGSGGGGSTSSYSTSSAESSQMTKAKTKIAAGDYAGAIPILTTLSQTEPDNADVFNLLGFSYRKTGDLDGAAPAYAQALTINPKHRGALEYQGEMYLQMGDVAKAEANLARLDDICWLSCDEERELKNAIAEWRATNGS